MKPSTKNRIAFAIRTILTRALLVAFPAAMLLCLAMPSSSLAAKRSHPVGRRMDLKVERRFDDGWKVRVLSWGESLPPAHSRIELWSPKGRLIEVIDAYSRIGGVRFIDRDTSRPLIQIYTYTYGNGYQAWGLSWLCVDRNEFERVLDLPESTSEADLLRDGRWQVQSAETLLYNAANLEQVKWPVVRTRTVEKKEIRDRTDKLLSSSTKVTETEYRFDIWSRTYRATSQRKLTDEEQPRVPSRGLGLQPLEMRVKSLSCATAACLITTCHGNRSDLGITRTSGVARKLFPVDEGPRDRSFVPFRRRLMAAARRHDRRFIYSIVARDIEFTFGEGEGITDFKRMWDEQPAGELERELIAVLSLGGAWHKKGNFCAPYIWARLPDDLGEDGGESAVILARNIRMRARPSIAAPTVAVLSYDIVRMDRARSVPPNGDHPTWAWIITPTGRNGYVAGHYIRSAVDYRACFEKRRGQWRMTIFIAGD
jgi:hypothetical protein